MPGGTTPQLGNIAMGQILYASLTPAATVTTNASITSTYTINGLVVGDCIDLYAQGVLTTYLVVGAVWVSAANTLSVQWVNSTSASSSSSPTAITFAMQVTRCQLSAYGVTNFPTAIV